MDALNSYPICSLIASMIFWLVSIETFRWFFDLTHYRRTSMSRANSGMQKPRARFQAQGFSSGDVLLSHNLSSHYHRGCSVSLPCSEWERVVPPRYDHQRSEPDWPFAASQRRKRGAASLGTGVRRGGRPTIQISKEQSTISYSLSTNPLVL